MKKIIMSIVLIVTLMFSPLFVRAENINVAKVNGKEYATIEEAMTAAEGTSHEVILLSNVTLSNTKIVNKDLTINLNGYNIEKNKLLFEVKGATFTVKGTGKLRETTPYLSPVAVYGSETPKSNYTTVNIEKDVILEGWSGLMVRESKKFSKPEPNANNNSYGVVVNFDGTAKGVNDISGDTGVGIYINGSIQNVENKPIVNIDKNAVLEATGFGLMIQGNSEININSAKITGIYAGIEIKSGDLNIKNAVITGTGEDKTPTQGYNNGANPSGAALQIEANKKSETNKNGYFGNININIENSTLESKQSYAYYEFVTEKSQSTEVKSLTLKDCKFVSAQRKEEFKVSDSYKEKYTKNITVKKIPNATITVDKSSALIGEKVNIFVKVNEGYELKDITINGKTVELVDNSFTMIDKDVEIAGSTIKIETIADVPTIDTEKEIEDVTLGIKDANKVEDILIKTLQKNTILADVAKDKALKIDMQIGLVEENKIDNKIIEGMKTKAGNAKITDFFDISIAVKETLTNNKVAELTELTEEIELMILLPEKLKNTDNKMNRKYYVVREHEGEYELINATLSEDGNYLLFKTNKFSTYALAYEDNVKTNPKTGDNILMTTIISGLSIIGMCGAIYYIKSKELFN